MGPSTKFGASASRSMIGIEHGQYHPIRHLACHAKFNRQNPLLSGIYLADDELFSVADCLRRAEAYRMTVLSCCDSGRIGASQIGSSTGLPTLLVAAGNAGVLATLWPIYDLTATLLTIRFYDCWLDDKLAPVLALARAQEWLVDSGKLGNLDYLNEIRARVEKCSVPELFRSEVLRDVDQLILKLQDTSASDLRCMAICTATAFFLTGI